MGFEVRTEVTIEAPPEEVWRALLDTDAYSAWNPCLEWRDGILAPGERIRFRAPLGKLMVPLSARVDRYDEGVAIGWTGLAGITRKIACGHHYFELSPVATSEGQFTRVVHGERFRGLPFSIAPAWMERKLEPTYLALNQALKRYLES